MCSDNRQSKTNKDKLLFDGAERTELLETIHEMVVQEVERRLNEPREESD